MSPTAGWMICCICLNVAPGAEATGLSPAAIPDYLALEDTTHGGLRGTPKTPPVVACERMLRSGGERELAFVRRALDGMLAGALRTGDGGFHEAARQADWTDPIASLPLATQADLLRLYARAAVVLSEPRYGEVAGGIEAFCRGRLLDDEAGLFRAGIFAGTTARNLPAGANLAMVIALHQAGGDLSKPAWIQQAEALYTALTARLTEQGEPRKRYFDGLIERRLGDRDLELWRRAGALLHPPVIEPVRVPFADAGDSSRCVALAITPPSGPADTEVAVPVRITIADGWHIYAADVKDEFLIASSIQLTAPAGTKVVGIDWPAHTLLEQPQGPPVEVYEGTVTATVRLRLGASTGTARLVVGVQACDDESCLPPAEIAVELRVIVQ